MSFRLQRQHQVRERLGGPAHQAHWISLGLQGLLQIRKPGWVTLRQLFPACSGPTNACSWSVGFACLPFFQTPLDRVEGDTCFPGDRAGTSSSLRLGGQVWSPLLLDSAWYASAGILVRLRAVPCAQITHFCLSLSSNSRKSP